MTDRSLARLVLAATLALGPQAHASTPTAVQASRAIQEVKVVTDELAAASQRLDVDAATKDFLIDKDSLVVDSDGEIPDPKEFIEGLRAFYASQSSLRFTTIRDEFRVLAPDLVQHVWCYKVEGTSKKGVRWTIDSETSSSLLRKIGGHWKFIFYHESAAPAKRLSDGS